MTQADPKLDPLFARARVLVTGGATLADAARAVGLTTDQVKKRSAREGWRADVPAPVRLASGPPEDLEARALLALDEAASSGRPLKPQDAIAIAKFAAERKAAPPPASLDLSHLSDRELDDLDHLTARAHGIDPIAGWVTPSEAEIARLRSELTARAAPVDHAPALAALETERDSARADLGRARAETEAARADLAIMRLELEQERSRVRGLEALLGKR